MHGNHHVALGDFQIQRLVETLAAMFDQHVLAGDAEVGAAVLHVGGHIGGTHNEQPHIVTIGADDELARRLRILGGHDPRGGQ